MAPKRRTQAAQRTPSAQQAKLSFNGKPSKVTKATNVNQAKSSKKDPAAVEDIIAHEVKGEDAAEAPTSEAVIQGQAEQAAAPDPSEAAGSVVTTDDVLGGRAQQTEEGAVGGRGSGWVADEADRARKVTDTQIKKYWRGKEQERLAPRVHQEDLTVYEKVLREWDMSGQYGPCIGIARLKRWKRANTLGLQPPLEVLAVLLKQMDAGDVKSQRAHVDELMSSRFITES